jgi:hypothetical protein
MTTASRFLPLADRPGAQAFRQVAGNVQAERQLDVPPATEGVVRRATAILAASPAERVGRDLYRRAPGFFQKEAWREERQSTAPAGAPPPP